MPNAFALASADLNMRCSGIPTFSSTTGSSATTSSTTGSSATTSSTTGSSATTSSTTGSSATTSSTTGSSATGFFVVSSELIRSSILVSSS